MLALTHEVQERMYFTLGSSCSAFFDANQVLIDTKLESSKNEVRVIGSQVKENAQCIFLV